MLTVASYLRAFPGMLGPLALAMGVDRIPARVLNLLSGIYGKEALEQAEAVLTPAESRRLAARMRTEAKKAAERAAAADLSDAVCQVRVLGRLEVIAPHGPVADRDWCKRKARLLFAMLVARAGTDVPRGEIIEYLWPEMDEERALNNFYVVWSAMKRALAPNSIRETPCPFVEHVHGVCRIVPGRVVTDLDEFDAHIAAARKAREKGDAPAELAAIRAAEQVYRGDVLPGDIYDDWFAPVRARCRHEFEDAMLRAAQILEERGATARGAVDAPSPDGQRRPARGLLPGGPSLADRGRPAVRRDRDLHVVPQPPCRGPRDRSRPARPPRSTSRCSAWRTQPSDSTGIGLPAVSAR